MDREGKLSIADATVLAGGNQGMTPVHQSLTINQQYIYTTQSYSSNKVISIKNGESIIRNTFLNMPVTLLVWQRFRSFQSRIFIRSTKSLWKTSTWCIMA